jgi:hypothetical protein
MKKQIQGGLHMFKNLFFTPWHQMFLAVKEKRFAKRVIRCLLEAYSVVSAEKPDLSDKALYREVLLHTQQVDPLRVDQLLLRAEDSIDEWTAPGRNGLGFREIAHLFVLTQYQAIGHKGTIVSFGEIVDSLIPADL